MYMSEQKFLASFVRISPIVYAVKLVLISDSESISWPFGVYSFSEVTTQLVSNTFQPSGLDQYVVDITGHYKCQG